MKVITCASYFGTGSSAICDLFSEYDNVYSLTDIEFRFLQDPDGISDLEFNLVENHNRHNSGHALKRYKRLVDFYSGNILTKRYEKYINGWRNISYKYIEELTDFKYKGWWQYDLYDKGEFYYYRKLIINKLLRMTVWRNTSRRMNVLPNEITYCSRPTPTQFIKITKNYISELLNSANKNQKEFIMVDQIVAPSNVNRYTKYFDDIKVIIVERDPRDIYLLAKYVWKTCVIPTESAQLFCEWFLYTRFNRESELKNEKTVKLVQFEDLVYQYDKKVDELENWVGISPSNHQKPFTYLNPDISKNNTQLWKKISHNSDDIKYIEKN